jgi:hypothetical protein
VERRHRPDLLVDNRAGLAVNLTRRGQGPGSGVPEEFASASVAGTGTTARATGEGIYESLAKTTTNFPVQRF